MASRDLATGGRHRCTGVLFIQFNVDGDPRKTRAYFKDVGGRLLDEFTIRAL